MGIMVSRVNLYFSEFSFPSFFGISGLVVFLVLSPLSANFPKWSSKLKQFLGKLPTNCLSAFHHFVRLALKGLNQ